MIPSTAQRIQEQRVRLNPQGLARKDLRLMSAMVPEDGDVLVSADLGSGEPTATAHYSQDANYYDATFGMVGKLPYYNDAGFLKIDSIYLNVMSVTPMGKATVRELYSTTYGTETFSDRWVRNEPYEDSKEFQDYIKSQIKKEYAFHKIGVLGMGYAMGPKKFQNTAYDAGYVISFGQAKDFYNTYWGAFPHVRRFADLTAAHYKKAGVLVNDFGYRLLPDKEYKAFNYWIQSTVSGIMHVLCAQFFALAPYCKFLLVIHDEIIFSCKKERVEEARLAMKQAEANLNSMLKWRVKVRVGFKVGNNMYEAK